MFTNFYRAMLFIARSRWLCCDKMSVCLSVTRWYSIETVIYSNICIQSLVRWPLMGGLLHLVLRGGAQSPPRCTECNRPSINGQCINFILFDVPLTSALWRVNGQRSLVCCSRLSQTELHGHMYQWRRSASTLHMSHGLPAHRPPAMWTWVYQLSLPRVSFHSVDLLHLPTAIAKAGIVFNVSVCLSVCLSSVNKPKSGSGCLIVMWTVYQRINGCDTTSQTSYLHNLISLQRPRSTRSSSVVTLSRAPTISLLKITDRSFRYASPRLWNQLPDSFRQPCQSCLDSPPHSLVSSSLLSSPLSSSITPSLFHSRLKTHIFNKSFPP